MEEIDKRPEKKKDKKSMVKEKPFLKKRFCKFCADENETIDYKDPLKLKRFTTEKGKILPARITGNCAKHQRRIAEAIKRARYLALLPYVGE